MFIRYVHLGPTAWALSHRQNVRLWSSPGVSLPPPESILAGIFTVRYENRVRSAKVQEKDTVVLCRELVDRRLSSNVLQNEVPTGVATDEIYAPVSRIVGLQQVLSTYVYVNSEPGEGVD